MSSGLLVGLYGSTEDQRFRDLGPSNICAESSFPYRPQSKCGTPSPFFPSHFLLSPSLPSISLDSYASRLWLTLLASQFRRLIHSFSLNHLIMQYRAASPRRTRLSHTHSLSLPRLVLVPLAKSRVSFHLRRAPQRLCRRRWRHQHEHDPQPRLLVQLHGPLRLL